MCKHQVRVKSNSPYGVKFASVPCGECAECRKKLQMEWTTRLKCELEHYHFRRKFNVGFITLTYNERHLPHIPRRYFKRGEYKHIPCFSYIDIKRFITGVRNWFFRCKHLSDGYRFFLSSEYGEKKHRPHYHMVFMYDSRVSPELMYQVLTDLWCGTTEVIPNNPKHKKKRRCYGIVSPFSDFVPRDNYAVGSYVAKYVCKDIEFGSVTDGCFNHLTKRLKNQLRWFKPFHKQSRAFGSCFLSAKTDEQCLDYLINGIPFVGTKALTPLPRYLRDKLLFKDYNYYDLKNHKNKVYKVYTSFFYSYRDLVYNLKFEAMKKKFSDMCQESFWKKYYPKDFDNPSSDVKTIVDSLGLDYLAYFASVFYGLPYKRCHVLDFPADNYISRYDPCADLEDYPLINYREYGVYSSAIRQILSFEECLQIPKRSEVDKVVSQCRAFHMANVKSL